MKKMGPLTACCRMLPGLPKEMRNAKIDDRDVARIEAIIRSMTPARADRPDGHQRLAPAADRARQRHVDHRRQQPATAVQGDAEDDAVVGPMAKLAGGRAGAAKAGKAGKGNRKKVRAVESRRRSRGLGPTR